MEESIKSWNISGNAWRSNAALLDALKCTLLMQTSQHVFKFMP